jgi:hypothetical protein
MAKKEIKGFIEYRGFASCGGRVVHHCVDAGNEGLRNYSHPRQGSAKDCSVIAALSSIQAVASGRISGAYPTYKFKSGTITIPSRKITVDSTGTRVYANSTGGSWPMLWEKAFAKLISPATCPKPATCPNRDACAGEPDISAAFANGYSGFTALMEIGRYKDVVTGAFSIDGTSGNMLAPAIGTTRSDFVEDYFFKRDHDYSVLGYNVTTKKYLIRNPCAGAELWVGENEFKAGSPHFAVWGYVTNPQ